MAAFQSSPDSKVGCNQKVNVNIQEKGIVSILTRLEGRVQHEADYARVDGRGVSILTRLEGRVQLGPSCADEGISPSFNPHPTRRSGATELRRQAEVLQ